MHIDSAQIQNMFDTKALFLVYQPQISLVSGQLEGLEALVRWQKGNEVLSPKDFLPAIFRLGYGRTLTLHLFKRLMVEAPLILSVAPHITLSFNVNAEDFYTGDLSSLIEASIMQKRILPHQLEIEITEDQRLLKDEQMRQRFAHLAQLGVQVAMDDFGRGYSSLESLSNWPFTSVKLDMSFVQKMLNSDKDLFIVKTAISLAHDLKLKVIAEGVEDVETYTTLAKLGCDMVQGFYVAKPKSLGDILSMLNDKPSWAPSAIGVLRLAQNDHLQWRRQVLEVTIKQVRQKGQSPDMPQLNPRHCRLGEWYYHCQQEVLLNNPIFRQLDAIHQEAHAAGKKLIESSSFVNSLDELYTQMEALSQISTQLMELLLALEDQLLLSE